MNVGADKNSTSLAGRNIMDLKEMSDSKDLATVKQTLRRILRALSNGRGVVRGMALSGYQPSKPIFGVDHLSNKELEELNALLPWACFVSDGQGRRFGLPTSPIKRSKPQEVPDRRIVWLNERLPLRDLTVLEIGCFEGIHTIALCQHGASVKACDARVVNVVKTIARCAMFNVHPQVIVWNVEDTIPAGFSPACDVIHHVGVLYHLLDPVTHLQRLAPHARRAILLDTHYTLDSQTTGTYAVLGQQYAFKAYREGGKRDPFSGMYDTARWLRLGDLVSLLQGLGFVRTEVLEQRDERNGPRCLIFAERDRQAG